MDTLMLKILICIFAGVGIVLALAVLLFFYVISKNETPCQKYERQIRGV